MLYDVNRAWKCLLTIRLIAYSIHVELRNKLSSPSFFFSYRRFRRIALTLICSRLLVYSLALFRDISHSRLSDPIKTISDLVSPHLFFEIPVNSNRSIALKGLGRAVRVRPSLNDVEKEIKNRDHPPSS